MADYKLQMITDLTMKFKGQHSMKHMQHICNANIYDRNTMVTQWHHNDNMLVVLDSSGALLWCMSIKTEMQFSEQRNALTTTT
jgi:hypothetical protein